MIEGRRIAYQKIREMGKFISPSLITRGVIKMQFGRQEMGYAKRYNKGDRKRHKRRRELENEVPKKENIKMKSLRILPWHKIMLWAVLSYIEEGKSVRYISNILGVARSTVYNWIKRYREGGEKALRYRSRRPHRVHRIDPEIVEKIVELYNMGYGTFRIAYELGIGHMTVWRYLVKLKIIKRGKHKQRKYRVFERKHTNSLWQMDLTCIDYNEDIWAIVIIDDHSRFVIAFKIVYHLPTINDIIAVLENAFHTYGVPKQILTDRGTQFYAVRGNTSTFDMYLEEWGVKHILAGVRHPQTNGKVERVIRTFKEECLNKTEWTKDTVQNVVDKYREFYNYHRPHIIYVVYDFYGIKKKKRIVIIPYLRFATHAAT